jgi:AraC-like DNA-binding protein
MFKEKRYDLALDKYFFLLKDDYFEFPYVSNSPQSMVKSLLQLPIFKHKSSAQCITTNNAFCNSELIYRKLEEGFWFMYTSLNFKQNVHSKATFTSEDASEYYFLSFSVFANSFPVKNYESEPVRQVHEYWTLQKSNTAVSTYFHKGLHGKIYKLCFTAEWVRNYSAVFGEERGKTIENFLDSKAAFYTWIKSSSRTKEITRKMEEILENEILDHDHLSILYKYALNLLVDFVLFSIKDTRLQENVALSNSDYYNVAKAENIIHRHLSGTFPGIRKIAALLNISASKLKRDFKVVYGLSMLQYHKEKNMMQALNLVKNSNLQIQYIAALTGFETASKFTAAFKKKFGQRPSDFR